MSLIKETDYGTPKVASEKMVTLEIDGQEITVPEGTSIMRASMEAGIQIPKLCATDMVDAFGSCRLCLVEIEGRKGTPASCTTPVAPGIKVKTRTPPAAPEAGRQSGRKVDVSRDLYPFDTTPPVRRRALTPAEELLATSWGGAPLGSEDGAVTGGGEAALALLPLLDLPDGRHRSGSELMADLRLTRSEIGELAAESADRAVDAFVRARPEYRRAAGWGVYGSGVAHARAR